MPDPTTASALLRIVEAKLAKLRLEYRDPNAKRSKTAILLEAKPLTALKKKYKKKLGL